ncbi:nose resistant to fluoxetine protein 6-like [Drosophila serrata]|uniref:nose resistant to fluoxetine protein 6-like n=1 Tax=Drosophila serrata TaxID=7274 RepID=UPI000A1D2316|nr:nose resistant to fluoxetine protein 6-like [Drosophila serrata]
MANIVGFIFLCGLLLVRAAQPMEEDVLQKLQGISQLRSLGLAFAEFFKDVTLDDLDIRMPRLPTEADLLCYNDMTQFMTALKSGELWALNMIDAWGSIPSGLLTGNAYDLGNFDECLNIKKGISETTVIRGKYCFLRVSLGEFLGVNNPKLAALSFNTATCFPASCSAAHMNAFMGQLMNQLVNSSINGMSISDSSCQTSEREPWSGLMIFTVVILSLMGSAVGLFTLFDYLFCTNQTEVPVIVKIFSARANSRALFRIVQNKSNPNVIECLHGIRCMSLFWVIISHQYGANMISACINILKMMTWLKLPYSSIIVHGGFAVDSFLFLGGLLVALVALRSMDRTHGKINVLLMYLHRLIRIFPILAIAILVYTNLMTELADGPLLQSGYTGKSDCETGWYWTLLFVNNYTKAKCLSHSWYLSVDMQLFIISPILLISLYKWGKKAAAAIFILTVLLIGCLFATMMVNNYTVQIMNEGKDGTQELYYATHTHATPWLIGFLFGYFLHLNRGKQFQLSWVVVWAGWGLCLAMIFTSIFALYPSTQSGAPPLSTLAESFYYTLTRVGWPLALCWVVFACMQGYGGLANSFLSSPLWQPLSKLSYSAFIWHLFIMEINERSVRTNTFFSDYQVMLKFWSTLGFTLLLSYLMYLLVEAPFGGLDNFLQSQKKPTNDKTLNRVSDQTQLNKNNNESASDPRATEARAQILAD